MLDDRITKLSDVQKQCLRHAAEGRSSKEIAPLVGLTHQTVDQYLYRARVLLGAENRREAARIFAEIERAEPFKGFELKPAAVEKLENSGTSDGPTEQPLARPRLFGLPPIGGPSNDLTLAQRLIAIGKIAFFLLIVVLTMILILKNAFVAFSPR